MGAPDAWSGFLDFVSIDLLGCAFPRSKAQTRAEPKYYEPRRLFPTEAREVLPPLQPAAGEMARPGLVDGTDTDAPARSNGAFR